MNKYIIDTITRDGINTSFLTSSRYETPKPGDPVILENGKYGMIDAGAGWGLEPDQLHLCRGVMGAFMGESHINISGGPFEVVRIEDLQPLHRLHPTKFWTWARYAQAGGGVSILIYRPAFKLKREADQ